MTEVELAKRHAGKVALVTGASRNIGRATAVRLALEGADIVIAGGAKTDVTEKLVRDLGVDVLAFNTDVGSESEVKQLADDVLAHFGKCDIIVNNAAALRTIPGDTHFEDVTLEQWQRVQGVNVDGMFLVCRAFAPTMRANKWGRIINIGSNTYGQMKRGLSAYITSKGGVIGFTRAISGDLGEYGITVNAIMPGLMRTEEGTAAGFPYEERALRQANPRVGLPEDIANAVSFFASEDASFITAQTLVVDGGNIRI